MRKEGIGERREPAGRFVMEKEREEDLVRVRLVLRILLNILRWFELRKIII